MSGRLLHFEHWDTLRTADSADPLSVLIEREESASDEDAPDHRGDLSRLLREWIGTLDPYASLDYTARIAGHRARTPAALRWFARYSGQQPHRHPAELARRVYAQLRIIHQSATTTAAQEEEDTASSSSSPPALAGPVLDWLLAGARPTARTLLIATRGVYCVATRVDPSLILHQSLGALGTLWNVTAQALCHQTETIFFGTGISGAYHPLQRHWRASSAAGNLSRIRSKK